MSRKGVEKILAVAAIIIAVIAGILGLKGEVGDAEGYISGLLPDSTLVSSTKDGNLIVIGIEDSLTIGYIVIEKADGYGGEISVAILIDTLGLIEDLRLISHGETPSYITKVEKKGLYRSLIGKSYSDPFENKNDIDVISGATYTSEGLIVCARDGSRRIAREELGFNVPLQSNGRLIIGIPEIALVILYLLAFVGIYSNSGYKRFVRWFTLIAGLLILGFWFAVPLSLSRINSLLIGFWPDWHTNLYWYILIFGFFLTIIVARKNVYCAWICPVGSIQDCLGVAGGAKPRFSRRFNSSLRWVQRFVAWSAIVLALYFRNPVKLNYEIFGVAVNLTGASYLFILTGFFFIVSLFVKRPWCNYLCPITPLAELTQMVVSRRRK